MNISFTNPTYKHSRQLLTQQSTFQRRTWCITRGKSHLALLFRHPSRRRLLPKFRPKPPRGCCCSLLASTCSFGVSAKLANRATALHTPAPPIGASIPLPPVCFGYVWEIFLKRVVWMIFMSKVRARERLFQDPGVWWVKCQPLLGH